MSLVPLTHVFLLTVSELFGNSHLKHYATSRKGHNLLLGILGYCGVIYFLIKALAGKSLMWTCLMWEAMVVIGGALTAYYIFGERFTCWVQYAGILFALLAAWCVSYTGA